MNLTLRSQLRPAVKLLRCATLFFHRPGITVGRLLCAAIAVCIVTSSVRAAITVPIPLPELIRRSHLILEARVASAPERVTQPGTGVPIQRVRLALQGEPLKGKWAASAVWDSYAENAPHVREGSLIVLFLGKPEGGVIDTLGPGGYFLVTSEQCEHGSDKCSMAVNPLNNEGLWNRSLWHEFLGKTEPSEEELWAMKGRFEAHVRKHIRAPQVQLRVTSHSAEGSIRGPIPLELIRESVSFLDK